MPLLQTVCCVLFAECLETEQKKYGIIKPKQKWRPWIRWITWVMCAWSPLQLSTIVFLAVRISSKEAPSLTPSSLIAFSKDISEGRESSAMESFAFASSRKDRCCCESLLLEHGFQAWFFTSAKLAKLHMLCPCLELFVEGAFWSCTVFADKGKHRKLLHWDDEKAWEKISGEEVEVLIVCIRNTDVGQGEHDEFWHNMQNCNCNIWMWTCFQGTLQQTNWPVAYSMIEALEIVNIHAVPSQSKTLESPSANSPLRCIIQLRSRSKQTQKHSRIEKS